MAPPVATTSAEKTSLQRLLALDKTYETLEDRIDAARELLGLDSQGTQTFTRGGSNYGRHDFVFNWALDKAKKDAAARINPRLWGLLHDVLAAIPEARVAKMLATSGVTATVISAMSDLQQGGKDSVDTTVDQGSDASNKKKRKRSQQPQTNGHVTVDSHAIFVEISRFVHRFRLPSTTQQVAVLARLWFTAMSSLPITNDEVSLHQEVHFISELWHRITRTTSESENHAAFAREMAWPAITLQSRAHKSQAIDAERELKSLIRRKLLVPAHKAFLSSALSGQKEAADREAQATFGACVNQALKHLQSSSGDNSEVQQSEVKDALGILFHECDHLKEHHSPRERRAHAKWVETLFMLVYTSIDPLDEAVVTRTVKKELILAMLAQIDKDVLSGPILEKVVLEYAGLSDAAEPDFVIIARALFIDASVFSASQKHADLTLERLLTVINTHSCRISEPTQSELDLWVHKLAVPLVGSQTQPQRAEKFLQELMKSISETSVDWCVWQQPASRDAIARLLQSSISVPAIRKLIDGLSADLERCLDNKADVDAADSRLLALELLIDCIRDDAAIDELQSAFATLQQKLHARFFSQKAGKVRKEHLWAPLAALQARIETGSTEKEDGVSQKGLKASAEDALKYLKKEAKSKSSSAHGISTALLYLLQCLQHSKDFDDLQADVLETMAGLTAKHAGLLASAIAQVPRVFSQTVAKEATDVHDKIVKQLQDDTDRADGTVQASIYFGLATSGCPLLVTEGATASSQSSSEQQATETNGHVELPSKLRKALKTMEAARLKSAMTQDLNAQARHEFKNALVEKASTSALTDVLSLLSGLLKSSSAVDTADLTLTRSLILALPTSAPTEPAEAATGRAIAVSLIEVIRAAETDETFNAASQCLRTVLTEKRWLVNQDIIESTLAVLHGLCSPSAQLKPSTHARFIYNDICSILRAILRFHRPSLGGRLHIVMQTLAQLLACLFVQSKNMSTGFAHFQSVFKQPDWLLRSEKSPTADNARAFARLITLLCNPPQSTIPGYRAHSDQVRLVDVVREARLHVSEFTPDLLGSYCHFQLHGVLSEGLREALVPAVQAIFDVMDMAEPDDERVKALNSRLGNAEKALLRREHGEWKRFGRWTGA